MTATFVRYPAPALALAAFHADHHQGPCRCPSDLVRVDTDAGLTVLAAVNVGLQMSRDIAEPILLSHIGCEVILDAADSAWEVMRRWDGFLATVADVSSVTIEANRARVGHASTILDPAPSTRTTDTAAIICAIDGCIDLIDALRTSLGATGSTTGPHAVLLAEVRSVRQRMSNRIREGS